MIQGTCYSIVSILSDIMYPEIMIDASSCPNSVLTSLINPSSVINCDNCSVNVPAQVQAVNLPSFLLIEFHFE